MVWTQNLRFSGFLLHLKYLLAVLSAVKVPLFVQHERAKKIGLSSHPTVLSETVDQKHGEHRVLVGKKGSENKSYVNYWAGLASSKAKNGESGFWRPRSRERGHM